MMPKCGLCGSVTFKTHHEYEAHNSIFHGLKPKIKPFNVTGRTRQEIVRDAEDTWLKPFVYDVMPKQIVLTTNNDDEHLPACNCGTCLNRRLDAIIAASEKSLETLQESVILEHEEKYT